MLMHNIMRAHRTEGAAERALAQFFPPIDLHGTFERASASRWGVVSNFPPFLGTGAGSRAQALTELGISENDPDS